MERQMEAYVAKQCKEFADKCAAVPLAHRNTAEYRELFSDYAAACFELRRLRQKF